MKKRRQNDGINEDLTTHEEPFDVVSPGSNLAKPAHCLNNGFHSKARDGFEKSLPVLTCKPVDGSLCKFLGLAA